MAIKSGHSFPKSSGFTGSAGMIPVKPSMRRPPKAGKLAIMNDLMSEGAMHGPNLVERARRPGGMKHGGKCNW